MTAILQGRLPYTPWSDPALSRMPGMRPVEGHWAIVDDAYQPQLAEKARLLRARRDDVLCLLPEAEAAAEELRAGVLADLPPGFARTGAQILRPDGVRVDIDGPPLLVLSRLLQEDLLILTRGPREHVLSAGLLCFPASWTLSEKIGRPLTRIHRPVPDYDADIAHRVQRMFDRVQVGRPMWRANALAYARPDLNQPHGEADPRPASRPARFLRSERQTVLRLPRTGAVVFTVHTYVVRLQALTAEQRATCPLSLTA